MGKYGMSTEEIRKLNKLIKDSKDRYEVNKKIENQYLTVDEQFKKTLNNKEIDRIQDSELRELRRSHWEYQMKIFKDEQHISDQEMCRLIDIDCELEAKELAAYRERKGI